MSVRFYLFIGEQTRKITSEKSEESEKTGKRADEVDFALYCEWLARVGGYYNIDIILT
ncbi:MAG: hypothetical protein ACJASB_001055 [Shewanella psychromarinicola]|jgi:hypothetical protein